MATKQKPGTGRKILSELFQDKHDLETIESLVGRIRQSLQVEGSVSGTSTGARPPSQKKARLAIERVRSAVEDLKLLLELPAGLAAALHPEIAALPAKISEACDLFETCRQTLAPKNRIFSDHAIANLVAYVIEKTGKPHHAAVADALREIRGSGAADGEQAHRRWCQHHRKLIASKRSTWRRFDEAYRSRLAVPTKKM